MKSESGINILLWIVILVAIILRFWNLESLPFFYDEVSAILRTRYSNWSDHLKYGVKPDGHPPFVQTFLWIFTKIFGENSYLLKSIAAILGTFAVYFIYKAGKTLFHRQAATLAAAILALSFPTVYWSQQIRPYSFGLAAITATFWLYAVLVSQKKNNQKHYILFGILIALNCYIHYFAGLTAVLLGIILIIQQYRTNAKSLLIATLIALFLLLPGYSIFIAQINIGGLGWLGKPSFLFFPNHLLYTFSNSWLFLVLILSFSIFAIWKVGIHKTRVKQLLYMLVVFVFPMLIGFLYSVLKSPVLQNSVLIFSMPALLLIISGIANPIPWKTHYTSIALVLLVGIYSLVYENKYYSLIQKEPYTNTINEFKPTSYTFIFDGARDIAEFHLSRKWGRQYQQQKEGYGIHFQYLLPKDSAFHIRHIRQLALKANFIQLGITSGSNPFIIPIFEDIYGKSIVRKSYVGGEYIEFQRKKNTTNVQYNRHYLNNNSLNIKADIIQANKNDVLVFRFSPNTAHIDAEIQTSIFNNGKQIDWRSSKLNDFYSVNNPYGYHVIKLADIPGWNEDSELNISAKSNNQFISGLLEFRVSEGNPYLYGVK